MVRLEVALFWASATVPEPLLITPDISVPPEPVPTLDTVLVPVLLPLIVEPVLNVSSPLDEFEISKELSNLRGTLKAVACVPDPDTTLSCALELVLLKKSVAPPDWVSVKLFVPLVSPIFRTPNVREVVSIVTVAVAAILLVILAVAPAPSAIVSTQEVAAALQSPPAVFQVPSAA